MPNPEAGLPSALRSTSTKLRLGLCTTKTFALILVLPVPRDDGAQQAGHPSVPRARMPMRNRRDTAVCVTWLEKMLE